MAGPKSVIYDSKLDRYDLLFLVMSDLKHIIFHLLARPAVLLIDCNRVIALLWRYLLFTYFTLDCSLPCS